MRWRVCGNNISWRCFVSAQSWCLMPLLCGFIASIIATHDTDSNTNMQHWISKTIPQANWSTWCGQPQKTNTDEVISLFSQHNFPHIHIQLGTWQNSWSVNIKDTHLIWTAITILPKSRFEFFSFESEYKCIEDVKSNKEIYMRGNLSSYHKMLVFDTSSVSTNNWAFVTFLLLSVMIGFKHISKLNHQNCA